MDKKTQKIVSISIGLILSILIVVIGFRMLQGRGANAAPNELSCVRDGSTATVTWVDGQGGLGTVAYGSDDGASLPFFAQEQESPVSAGIAQHRHSVTIGPLPAGTSYHVAVEGFTDQSIACTGSDGSANDVSLGTPKNEGNNLTNLINDSSNNNQDPEPTTEPTSEPEPTVAEVISAALPLEMATSYYSDNTDKGISDCVEAFKFAEDDNGVRYTGLASTCSAAWTEVNLSHGSN
jgi:hypothetical protein